MTHEPEDELARLRRQNATLNAELTRRRDDAAAREADQAALHASERRLRDTLESIEDGFLLVNRDWKVIDLNMRTVRMDGRPASRLIGRHLFALWPDVLGAALEWALRKAMTERRRERLLHRMRRDERNRWIDVRIFPAVQGLALFLRDVTAQEESRERLRRAETSAHLAVEAARLGLWAYDPTTGALTCDARNRAMFGLSPDEAVDYPMMLARVHSDDRPKLAAAFTAAMAPGGSGEIVQDFRAVDPASGRERWLETTGQAQFKHGRCVRVDGVVQDVTERRRAGLALAESEGRFRAIAEATPAIVFVADPVGGNAYVNPQFCEFTGRSSSSLMGEGWLSVVHPDDRQHSSEAWLEAARSGQPYQVEQRLRRHDGAYRWFLCRSIALRQPERDAAREGRIVQWFGTGIEIEDLVAARQILARDRDALERLVAERTAALGATLARLREEEARMRALFQHSSECLFLLRVEPGRGRVFLAVNPPGEAVLRRPASEIIGRTPAELANDPAERREIEATLDAALTPGSGPHRYTARRRYGGEERVIEAVAVALDGPGAERLILITARDVTEQRALEEALRHSHKMDAIGQLTGGIAHDFNNLLTGIGGSLEQIRRRAGARQSDDIERYAAAAEESVRRAASLTHRLLAFARRQPLDPRPLDLSRLVGGMRELLVRTVGPAIRVETVLPDGLWPVRCDANQMESALLGLCLNAREAMPDGGTLRIETANRPGAEDGVSVSVVDTGCGMSDEVAAHAFEPFFTTRPIGQGSGLGLSMLYGFVRQSGGEVRLLSEPGRGTTVRIDLPRHHGALPEPDAAPPQPAAATPERPSILVVEDEELVRSLIVEVLDEQGFRVLQAADAASALEILQREGEPVDLLLTDVGLPGMNGRQLADAARAGRPGLKVLLITGYAHNAGGAADLVGPGMELLGKPFALDGLLDRVRSMLAG